MNTLLRDIDQLLRMRDGAESLSERTDFREGFLRLFAAVVVLAALYGFFMGWYAMFGRPEPEYRQVLASIAKVPLLFVCTFIVTFPSLYVFNTLYGSQLSFQRTVLLLLGMTALTAVVLAALGPVTAFFSLTTTSYDFMKLLNAFFFALSTVIGVSFLLKAARRWQSVTAETSSAGANPANVAAGAAPRAPRGGGVVLDLWLMLYLLVAAQMAWVLRPFLLSPDTPFELLREREANVFINLLQTLRALLVW